MECEFTGEVVHWRGPSQYHFVPLPPEETDAIRSLARSVTYGWGVIPVRATLGDTIWRTSLFPKDGGYLLPLRDSVRKKEDVELGDTVGVHLTVLGK
jgi:hypothetical protein